MLLLLLVSQSHPSYICVVLCPISNTAVSAAPSDTPNHTVRATGTPVRAARFVRRPACCLPSFSDSYLLNFTCSTPCCLLARALQALAAKVAALEGTETAIAVSSGMAAITSALLSLLEPGDHLLTQVLRSPLAVHTLPVPVRNISKVTETTTLQSTSLLSCLSDCEHCTVGVLPGYQQ